MMGTPHCFGNMDWILKYEENKIPNRSICKCAYTKKCLLLTNNKRKKQIKVGDK